MRARPLSMAPVPMPLWVVNYKLVELIHKPKPKPPRTSNPCTARTSRRCRLQLQDTLRLRRPLRR